MTPRILSWYRLLLDKFTRANSAFTSFEDLVNAHIHYRPTILHDIHPEKLFWAKAYDSYQRKRKDPRRCFPPLNGVEAQEEGLRWIPGYTHHTMCSARKLRALQKAPLKRVREVGSWR